MRSRLFGAQRRYTGSVGRRVEPRRSPLTDRVVVSPLVQGGEPVIRGTRVTLLAVAAHLRAGLGSTDIQDSFPHLSDEDIRQAIQYYDAHRAELDAALDAEEQGEG